MTLNKFKEFNNKYRMVCEWSEDLKTCDKDSVFIPCWANSGMIYWIGGNYLRLIIFSSPKATLDKIKEETGIEFECFGECGDYSVDFQEKYFDIIAKYFKAKPQAKRIIPPHSIRNVTTFLRVAQNIHPRYKDILNNYIKQNSK